MKLNSVKENVHVVSDKVVSLRRALHARPELGFEEEKTAALVSTTLKELGLQVTENVGGSTGVVGLLEGDKPGKTIALRADMDALPIQEVADVPYRSRVPGVMHACGHDAHVAMLLGTAEVLSKFKKGLKGNVKFIFQPGEEGKGGGKVMVESGVLEAPRVDAIFALHVWPELPLGTVGYRHGTIMASSDHFRLVVEGKSAHGASPHHSIDALLIGSMVVQALQTIVSRNLSPVEPGVISIGSFHSGSSYNVIPGKAELMGTVRAANRETAEVFRHLIEERIHGIVSGMGGSYQLVYDVGYPPTINDSDMTVLLKEVAAGVVGDENLYHMPAPSMCGEDFSFYLQRVPGSYFYLGVGPNEPDQGFPGLHHPSFDFCDANILPVGVEIFTLLALNFLR